MRILIILGFLLFSCSSSQISNRPISSSFNEVAKNYFKEKYVIKENENGEFALIYKKYKRLEDLFFSIHYIVYDRKKSKVIIAEKLPQGTVKWMSKYELFTSMVENKKDKSTRKVKNIYNILTLQRYDP